MVVVLGCLSNNIVIAQDQQKAYPVTSYLKEEAYVRGYTSLVLNYPFVRQQMIATINDASLRGAENKKQTSQHWLQWISGGVKKNYSIYWWMLADWYDLQGDKKNAYSSAVQAMVLSKIELASCRLDDDEQKNVLNGFLNMHRHIIHYAPNQNEIRTSVLVSVARAETQIASENALSGQACYRAYAIRGKIPEKLDSWRERNGFSVTRQTKALQEVKKELSYGRVVQTSSIEQILANDERKKIISVKRDKP